MDGRLSALLAPLLAYGVVAFFVGGHPGSYENVRQFTRADFEFFRSVASDDYGLIVNLSGCTATGESGSALSAGYRRRRVVAADDRRHRGRRVPRRLA